MSKALQLYTRTLVVWVLLFGVVAYVFPAPFVALGAGMKWFFALTMFGIGVVLRPVDFKRVAEHPWIVLVGVCAQFTLMPLGAFAVGRLLGLPDVYALGLVVTGAAPGAMTSNVMSYVAKGDAAYSVSLTAVATLLCPVLTPGLIWLLAGARMDVPFLGMFLDLLIMVVIPLLAGFGVRYFFYAQVEKTIDVFPAISATFIVFICSVVIANNHDKLPEITGAIVAADVLLNLYGLAGGYGVGALFRMAPRRRRTLAIEIGMQNAGLGVVLATAHFSAETALPAAFFVFLCIVTASLMSAYWQRGAGRRAGAAAKEGMNGAA